MALRTEYVVTGDDENTDISVRWHADDTIVLAQSDDSIFISTTGLADLIAALGGINK